MGVYWRAGKEQTTRNRLVFEDLRRCPARQDAPPLRGAVKRLPSGVEALDRSQAMLSKPLLAIKPFSWRQSALLIESGP